MPSAINKLQDVTVKIKYNESVITQKIVIDAGSKSGTGNPIYGLSIDCDATTKAVTDENVS